MWIGSRWWRHSAYRESRFYIVINWSCRGAGFGQAVFGGGDRPGRTRPSRWGFGAGGCADGEARGTAGSGAATSDPAASGAASAGRVAAGHRSRRGRGVAGRGTGLAWASASARVWGGATRGRSWSGPICPSMSASRSNRSISRVNSSDIRRSVAGFPVRGGRVSRRTAWRGGGAFTPCSYSNGTNISRTNVAAGRAIPYGKHISITSRPGLTHGCPVGFFCAKRTALSPMASGRWPRSWTPKGQHRAA